MPVFPVSASICEWGHAFIHLFMQGACALPASPGRTPFHTQAAWQEALRGLDAARMAAPLRVRSSQVPVGYQRLRGPLPARSSPGSHKTLFLFIHVSGQLAGVWALSCEWAAGAPCHVSPMRAEYHGHTVSSDRSP